MQIATADTWYRVQPLADGVTHIDEPHIKPFYRCNIWHVRGRDRDLLLDSGMGVVSLRRQITALAEVGTMPACTKRAMVVSDTSLLGSPDASVTA